MNLLGLLGAAQAPSAVAEQPTIAPPDLNAALAANALKPHPQEQSHGFLGGAFHQGGTISNILGAIGDAFLVQSGHEPMYANMMHQKKVGAALANYLGQLDPGMQDILNENPSVGLELYKMKHPASEVPAGLKEFQYYQGLQGNDRSAYEQFLKLTHPGMMSPVTLGPNDTYDPGGGSLPHVTDQATYDAVPPGAQYTAPDGKVRTKGGATASPSPTFSAR